MCKLFFCWKQTLWSCLYKAAGPRMRGLSDTQPDSGLQRKTGSAVCLRALLSPGRQNKCLCVRTQCLATIPHSTWRAETLVRWDGVGGQGLPVSLPRGINQCLYFFFVVLYFWTWGWVSVLDEPVCGPQKACAFWMGSWTPFLGLHFACHHYMYFQV